MDGIVSTKLSSIDEISVPPAIAAEAALVTPAPYFRRKVVIDKLLALLLLPPALLIMAVLVPLVRLTSRGPAIFTQRRLGRYGKVFTMYKIRTMVTDAEAGTGPVWSTGDDPRITPLGRFLRRLHLDELPQIWNVLRGDMALVGPRPERPEIVAQLAPHIPGYGRRLAVLPGITGLAQINLPPDSDLDSVRRKLVLDLEYIHHASPQLDLRMFLCSLLRLLGISGERAMRFMRVVRTPTIPAAWYPPEERPAASNGNDLAPWLPLPISPAPSNCSSESEPAPYPAAAR